MCGLNLDRKNKVIRIKIIGVGRAGGNTINTMIENSLEGVEFIAANTNNIDLKKSKAKVKLQLGRELTKGLGAGANPDVGRTAAAESREDIKNNLKDTDILFIAAGMGGGTGTGATPVIASLAREMDILTIGIVSRPFRSEGKKRMIIAENGIKKLRENVDTLIVVPNEKLNEINPDMTITDAFKKADNVLYETTKTISDIIHNSGYMNVDSTDMQTVMKNGGLAMMGSGLGDGDQRAVDAAQKAMNNPLLSDIQIENAKGVLINITAGKDFKMDEFELITNEIVKQTGDDGDIITGIIIDDAMEGKIKVTLITTGLDTPNTTVYERKTIINDKADESKGIGSNRRIRKADSLDLNKRTVGKPSPFPDKQMVIPTFIRKFSMSQEFRSDNVKFAITTPQRIQTNNVYLLDVWGFLEKDRENVIKRAIEEAEERIKIKSTESTKLIQRGTILQVKLEIKKVKILYESIKTILWIGDICNTTFTIEVPEKLSNKTLSGRVLVFMNSCEIACLEFYLNIADTDETRDTLNLNEKYYKTAFASYAHKDRKEVFKRIQGLNNAEVDVFVDVKNLRTGEHYKEKILHEISFRDIFYLFWSKAASKSKWVNKEWNWALEKRGIDFIKPIPLVSPDKVPPPAVLAEKMNFNDLDLMFIEYSEFYHRQNLWKFWKK